MTSPRLRQKCIDLYGQEIGEKLYGLMKKIQELNFCVATSWSGKQVSIARGCYHSGMIFAVSEDYNTIMTPDNHIISPEQGREIIEPYLPNTPKLEIQDREKHCQLDDR